MGYNKVYRLQHMSEWNICGYMDQFFKLYIEDYSYSRRSLIRSHLDAQILDTDYFLRLIELTVIYSKNAKSILKIRIKKILG
jgi:hypothetical protein